MSPKFPPDEREVLTPPYKIEFIITGFPKKICNPRSPTDEREKRAKLPTDGVEPAPARYGTAQGTRTVRHTVLHYDRHFESHPPADPTCCLPKGSISLTYYNQT